MSPFYPPLPDPVPRSGLMAGLGGFAATEEMQNIALKRQQMQMQMQQQNQMQAALGNYAQTQDPGAFRGVNPELEMKLRKEIASLPSEEAVRYSKLTSLVKQAAPFLMTNPDRWGSVKQMAERSGIAQPGELPDKITPEQVMQMGYAEELLKARLTTPKAVAPGGALVNPVTGQEIYKAPERMTTILTPEGGVAGQVAGPVKTLPRPPKESFDEKAYTEWLQANPGKSRMDYLANKKEISAISDDDAKSLVEGMKDGTIAPSQLSKRATSYNKILAEAKRQGVDITKAQAQFNAAIRAVSSLNSPQQIRLKGYAISVVNTIDEIKSLSDQLKQTGIVPLNRVALEAKIKLAGNTPEGQLATKYVTAVNTLKEEFANLAQGGYAPTESVWNLANKQINENFGVDQMKSALTEIQRLINYRVKAFDEIQPTYLKGDVPSQGPRAGEGGAKQITPQERQAYDQKLGQVKAMPDGPQKQQALKQLQELATKWGIQ